MTSSVGPVYLDCRQFGCRRSHCLLQTNTVITAEPAFIRKRNRSPLYPPMSSGLTPLASQMAMAWIQWNTRYRTPDLELSSLKK
ncbi:hypothetical protein TNCV_5134811 [Trichonephila clavipes]|nr:hypothetical protein TNCV_5134811 [Trichonephila clavipes]